MSDHLSAILEHKRSEIAASKKRLPLSELARMIEDLAPVRDFVSPLRKSGTSLIAEIKKASPSKGLIVREFDHRALASVFESGGARALSVLTDQKFFQGQPEFINEIKQVSTLPVLRKDFIVEEYQIYESRVLGADAILLIVRAMREETLLSLLECARNLGLTCLVEVHDPSDIEVTNRSHADVVGINNRDLSDFSVSLNRSMVLRQHIAAGCLTVSESGIRTRKDIERLRAVGFDAFLVGEVLMASMDQERTLRELIEG